MHHPRLGLAVACLFNPGDSLFIPVRPAAARRPPRHTVTALIIHGTSLFAAGEVSGGGTDIAESCGIKSLLARTATCLTVFLRSKESSTHVHAVRRR